MVFIKKVDNDTQPKNASNKSTALKTDAVSNVFNGKISAAIKEDNIWQSKEQKTLTNPTKENKPIIKINGRIEDFEQGDTGDCWALAGIKSISNTKKGAEIIKNMISQDKNGNVTVRLPHVKEMYTFSPKEIKEAEGRLSTGDDDVRVLELALEKHRLKLVKKGYSDETLKPFGLFHPKERVGNGNQKEPLKAGTGAEAFAILTGTAPYVNRNQDGILIEPDERIEFSRDKTKGDYLDMLQKNPQRYAATTYFDFDEGENIAAMHEYSIKAVDGDYVYLVNPWESSKTVKMKKDDFILNSAGIDFCDLNQK